MKLIEKMNNILEKLDTDRHLLGPEDTDDTSIEDEILGLEVDTDDVLAKFPKNKYDVTFVDLSDLDSYHPEFSKVKSAHKDDDEREDTYSGIHIIDLKSNKEVFIDGVTDTIYLTNEDSEILSKKKLGDYVKTAKSLLK